MSRRLLAQGTVDEILIPPTRILRQKAELPQGRRHNRLQMETGLLTPSLARAFLVPQRVRVFTRHTRASQERNEMQEDHNTFSTKL